MVFGTCLENQNHIGSFDMAFQISPSKSRTKMGPMGCGEVEIRTNAFEDTTSYCLGELDEKWDVPLVFSRVRCDNEGILCIR